MAFAVLKINPMQTFGPFDGYDNKPCHEKVTFMWHFIKWVTGLKLPFFKKDIFIEKTEYALSPNITYGTSLEAAPGGTIG